MSPKKTANKSKRRRGPSSSSVKEELEFMEHYDFEKEPAAYFLNITSFEDHLEAQSAHRSKYIATLVKLVQMKIDLLPSSKMKALACSWVRNDQEMSKGLLSMKKIFNIVEVSKAINLLDIPRQVKFLEKKKLALKALQESKKCVVKEVTFKKLERKILRLSSQKLSVGSVSGALSRHVREWIRNFDHGELEFMTMNFEKEIWKELADKVHFNPGKDFVNLPWFLPYCYGEPAPDISMLHRIGDVTNENVNEVIKTLPLPFHTISKFKEALTNESKAKVALHDDNVGRAIWWYEDLECESINQVILDRLNIENNVEFGYGKLMERLMLLRPKNVCFYPKLMEIAERKLTEYSHNLEGPIGVFADASGSMEVAIKIATIISSFLAVFTHAKLVFFNQDYYIPTKNPDSIADVIDMALSTKAENATAPAAALWPFYEAKEHLKTIIVVTDEEENTHYKDHMFAPLFQKYITEVGPCNLIFISFLNGQHQRGEMVTELKRHNISATQYVLCSNRPDISKLDSIIGKMSLNSPNFLEMISSIEAGISQDGAQHIFSALNQ